MPDGYFDPWCLLQGNFEKQCQGSEFETCWIEMIHPTKNILEFVCQHPKQKDKYFLKYLKKKFKQGCKRK